MADDGAALLAAAVRAAVLAKAPRRTVQAVASAVAGVVFGRSAAGEASTAAAARVPAGPQRAAASDATGASALELLEALRAARSAQRRGKKERRKARASVAEVAPMPPPAAAADVIASADLEGGVVVVETVRVTAGETVGHVSAPPSEVEVLTAADFSLPTVKGARLSEAQEKGYKDALARCSSDEMRLKVLGQCRAFLETMVVLCDTADKAASAAKRGGRGR